MLLYVANTKYNSKFLLEICHFANKPLLHRVQSHPLCELATSQNSSHKHNRWYDLLLAQAYQSEPGRDLRGGSQKVSVQRSWADGGKISLTSEVSLLVSSALATQTSPQSFCRPCSTQAQTLFIFDIYLSLCSLTHAAIRLVYVQTVLMGLLQNCKRRNEL